MLSHRCFSWLFSNFSWLLSSFCWLLLLQYRWLCLYLCDSFTSDLLLHPASPLLLYDHSGPCCCHSGGGTTSLALTALCPFTMLSVLTLGEGPVCCCRWWWWWRCGGLGLSSGALLLLTGGHYWGLLLPDLISLLSNA